MVPALLTVAIAITMTIAAAQTAPLSSQQLAPPQVVVSAACTHTVPSATTEVDGAKDLDPASGPGVVVCLPAGSRGNLRLVNLRGTPDRPIIVRNEGGPVRITGTDLEAGIVIMASSNLRVTGAGSEALCGAAVTPGEQRCGIEVDGTAKGIKIKTNKGSVGNLEIDHVAILRVTSEKRTRGILIHPLPGEVVTGLFIHHNHVANTLAEGIYLGSEPHGQPFDQLAKLRSVEVSYNLVEDTGYDGIKIKVAVADVLVHHNVIRNAGTLRTQAHQGGIKVATSVGYFYNNTVIGAVEGIRMGRELERPGTRYFNNLIVGVIDVGIDAPEDGAMVYNNTVVGSEAVGISAKGIGSRVEHNIIADAAIPLDTRSARLIGNLISGSAMVGFVDATAGDYRLAAGSPAVDGGPLLTPFSCDAEMLRYPKWHPLQSWPPTDLDDRPRPSGCRSDLGAFERSQPESDAGG